MCAALGSIALHVALGALSGMVGAGPRAVHRTRSMQLTYMSAQLVELEPSSSATLSPTRSEPVATQARARPQRRAPKLPSKPAGVNAEPQPQAAPEPTGPADSPLDAPAERDGAIAASQGAASVPTASDPPPRSGPPSPLVKLSGALPEYPLRARLEEQQGVVRVRIVVSPEGLVEQVEVISARPRGVFEQAALRAVRSWRFAPIERAREPVRRVAEQDIAFELRH